MLQNSTSCAHLYKLNNSAVISSGVFRSLITFYMPLGIVVEAAVQKPQVTGCNIVSDVNILFVFLHIQWLQAIIYFSASISEFTKISCYFVGRDSDWLRAGCFGDWIPVEEIFSAPIQTVPGPHTASCTMGNGSICLFFFGATAPQWAMASSFTRFLDHTQRRTTVGRTPPDEWSARRRDLYLDNSQQTGIMPPEGFEPTISAGERPKTYALDRAATGTGELMCVDLINP